MSLLRRLTGKHVAVKQEHPPEQAALEAEAAALDCFQQSGRAVTARQSRIDELKARVEGNGNGGKIDFTSKA